MVRRTKEVKMIIVGDTETYKKDENGNYIPILDATGKHFVVGCLYRETGTKKLFYRPEDMWNYIIKLGKSEARRNKKLTVYFHNARYDCYNIMDLEDKHIRWFSENPFITGYYETITKVFNEDDYRKWQKYAVFNKTYYKVDKVFPNGNVQISYKKEIIKFLDTLAIFKMSLAELGKVIKIPKMEMPTEPFKDLTKKKLREIGEYCANDCKIAMESIKFLKKKLKDDGIYIRNICTISQVAINYIIAELKKRDAVGILVKNNKGKYSEFVYKTKNKQEIHSAYRGGYVRVWKTGVFKGVKDLDCNSLYPYAIINMELPDLRTERRLEKPLENYELKDLLDNIGISRCMIYNEKNEYGLLPVRLTAKSYIPKRDKYLIGTWTHTELREAVKEGYKIIGIEWSIIWNKGYNPFSDIFIELYKKRKESKSDFDNLFYKSIMNNSIGKFGQTKVNQEIFIDSIEMIQKYLQQKIVALRGIEDSVNIVYSKKPDYQEFKKYYCPIIPALVTAYGRIYMYKQLKKIPQEDLLYMDTDSLIFIGEHINKFDLGNDMGKFKIEKDLTTGEELTNADAIIWGTKTKSIGNNLAVSGLWKKGITMEDFKNGRVKNKRLMGIRNVRSEDVGKFIDEERDLVLQREDFEKGEELLEQEKVYIDYDIENVSFFLPYLKELCITSTLESSKVYKDD